MLQYTHKMKIVVSERTHTMYYDCLSLNVSKRFFMSQHIWHSSFPFQFNGTYSISKGAKTKNYNDKSIVFSILGNYLQAYTQRLIDTLSTLNAQNVNG